MLPKELLYSQNICHLLHYRHLTLHTYLLPGNLLSVHLHILKLLKRTNPSNTQTLNPLPYIPHLSKLSKTTILINH